jgi:hypothetical protein
MGPAHSLFSFSLSLFLLATQPNLAFFFPPARPSPAAQLLFPSFLRAAQSSGPASLSFFPPAWPASSSLPPSLNDRWTPPAGVVFSPSQARTRVRVRPSPHTVRTTWTSIPHAKAPRPPYKAAALVL